MQPISPSPLAEAAERVGDRWALLLVDALLARPRRFGDLLEVLDGCAPNVLSKRLKQLEADGVVVTEPYSTRPPRHTYRLTASGRELAGALRLLAQWGAGRVGGGAAFHHQRCGTPVEARWWCPTCAQVVTGDDVDDLAFL